MFADVFTENIGLFVIGATAMLSLAVNVKILFFATKVNDTHVTVGELKEKLHVIQERELVFQSDVARRLDEMKEWTLMLRGTTQKKT